MKFEKIGSTSLKHVSLWCLSFDHHLITHQSNTVIRLTKRPNNTYILHIIERQTCASQVAFSSRIEDGAEC